MTTLQATAAATGAAREPWWERRRRAASVAATAAAAVTSARSAGKSERTTRLSGLAAAAGTSRSAGLASSGAAGLLLRLNVNERPLVVVVPPLIHTDRFVLALALDAHDPAGNRPAGAAAGAAPPAGAAPAAGAETTGRCCSTTGRRCRRRPASGPRLSRPARLQGLTRRSGRAEQIEVVVGDGILELLPQEMPLHEHVDARRECAGLPLEQPDRADVLLPAEDELVFLLPLSLMAPHGHGDGHEDRHHRDRHQQGRHRVTGFPVTSLTP
jgi:hypothetical protein